MNTQATIKAPFAIPNWQAPASATGTVALSIASNDAVIYLSGMAGAVTLNLTIDANVEAGSRLRIVAVQGATGRNVALGTGFITNGAADLTGVANDIDCCEFIYDGTQYIGMQAWAKVYDAA